MSDKFYTVLKPTYAFEAGAILKKDGDSYKAVSDIWNTEAAEGHSPSITARYVEHVSNKEWFQRVYAVNLLTKTVYKIKVEALELMNKEYKG